MKIVVALFSCLLALPASGSDWSAAGDARLAFKGSYQGEAFDGVFERFTPEVRFDPADPTSGRIEVEVDITSARTGNADYDNTMQDAEFFDSKRFPKARFVVEGFGKTGADSYRGDGRLTIRDRTVPVQFPFRFRIDGDDAVLTAALTLKRLDFDVGTGDWTDTDLIANEVQVEVELPLRRAGAP